MITLPYISLNGPKNKGPIAYARTNIDKVNDNSSSFVIFSSFPIAVSAGATIDDDTGEIKVKEDTMYFVSNMYTEC